LSRLQAAAAAEAMARTASRRRRSSLAGKRPGGGSAAPLRLLLALGGRGPGRRGERDGMVWSVSRRSGWSSSAPGPYPLEEEVAGLCWALDLHRDIG